MKKELLAELIAITAACCDENGEICKPTQAAVLKAAHGPIIQRLAKSPIIPLRWYDGAKVNRREG